MSRSPGAGAAPVGSLQVPSPVPAVTLAPPRGGTQEPAKEPPKDAAQPPTPAPVQALAPTSATRPRPEPVALPDVTAPSPKNGRRRAVLAAMAMFAVLAAVGTLGVLVILAARFIPPWQVELENDGDGYVATSTSSTAAPTLSTATPTLSTLSAATPTLSTRISTMTSEIPPPCGVRAAGTLMRELYNGWAGYHARKEGIVGEVLVEATVSSGKVMSAVATGNERLGRIAEGASVRVRGLEEDDGPRPCTGTVSFKWSP